MDCDLAIIEELAILEEADTQNYDVDFLDALEGVDNSKLDKATPNRKEN